ncbi:MAG: hypothetical protein PHG40_02975 [Candidatus Omnitrophica bacterium]|nr:hypothetical protein [Candidatus Omnitrophota bacterium]
MKRKNAFILAVAVILLMTGVSLAQQAQEQAQQAAPAPEQPVAQAAQEPAIQPVAGENAAVVGEKPEEKLQWLWGEAISVDAANSTLSVKYLDYEADMEKDIVITVDSQTTYENVVSLMEIKAKDSLSVDYLVTADGKNIARVISVEKPEIPSSGPEGAEITPQDTQVTP